MSAIREILYDLEQHKILILDAEEEIKKLKLKEEVIMQELKKGLEKEMDSFDENVFSEDFSSYTQDAMALQRIAEKWAIYCLRSHTDSLIIPGLKISAAISQYLHEMHEEK